MAASAGMTGSMPPAAPDDASATPPLPTPDASAQDRCDAVASYGLRMSADLSWDASTWLTGPGRGTAELYVRVDVSEIDAPTGAVRATSRVCGLALPPMNSPVSCDQSQLRFADTIWDQDDLPELTLQGHYSCAANGCRLEWTPPVAHLLGIRLQPPDTSWPNPGTTTVAQHPDDDADGEPGMTAAVTTQSSLDPLANLTCSATSGGSTGAGTLEREAGRVFVGLRVQLEAAIGLSSDCRATQGSGALHSLDLRTAGCVFDGGWNAVQVDIDADGTPDTAYACSEEGAIVFDLGLPAYAVLSAGEAPSPNPVSQDLTPSRGTQVQAVRFEPGTTPSCDQVRKAMF